ARMQCTNNLKQIALATIGISDLNSGRMPNGVGTYPDPVNATGGFGSTFMHILPFIEQDNLYKAANVGPTVDSWRLPKGGPYCWGDNTNTAGKITVYATGIKTYICPSE